MIVHVFQGWMTIHCFSIVHAIEKYSSNQHFYIFVCLTKEEKDKVLSFMDERKINSFVVILSNNKTFLFNKIWLYLLKYKKNHIVFHGNYYQSIFWFLFLNLRLFPHIFFITWGKTRLFRKSTNFLYTFINFCRLHVIRKFYIISLMYPDERRMKTYRTKGTATIPYPKTQIPDMISQNMENNIKILLGNSAWNIESYISFVKKIHFDCKNIELHLMMNYGKAEANRVEELTSLLVEKFDTHFKLCTEMMPFSDYLQWLSTFDYYACYLYSQTGLGAIYNAIFLGRNVILIGSNYQWMKKNGIECLHADDVFFNNGIKKTTIMDLQKNRDILFKLLNANDNVKKWDDEILSH